MHGPGSMTVRADVVVLGLGAVGSAAAWQVARAGRRVLGLERFGVAHDRGSSHGRSRLIRQAYFEDPAYVPLVLGAYDRWAALEVAARRRLLHRTGALSIGAAGGEAVTGTRQSAERWGLAHEVLTPAEVRRRFPTFVLGEGDLGVYEEAAGYLEPEAAVAAQVALGTAAGADLRFEQAPARWTVRAGGGVQVTWGDEVAEADVLVLTPGAWAPGLLGPWGDRLEVVRRVQYWFAPLGAAGAVRRRPVTRPTCSSTTATSSSTASRATRPWAAPSRWACTAAVRPVTRTGSTARCTPRRPPRLERSSPGCCPRVPGRGSGPSPACTP